MDDEQKLIDQHVVPDPSGRRVADARLQSSGVPVWTIVWDLRAVDGNADQVRRDYEISAEELEAALAYYRRHRAAIDARLEMNAA
jgi:uncharacterized protein (DUF433 family)